MEAKEYIKILNAYGLIVTETGNGFTIRKKTLASNDGAKFTTFYECKNLEALKAYLAGFIKGRESKK